MLHGLLSGLSGIGGGRTGGTGLGTANIEGGLSIPAGFSGNAGRKDLTRADFYTTNVIFSANNAINFEELGTVTVLAQQALRWGFGTTSAPSNQGMVYADIEAPDTAGDQQEGFLRLVWKDANKFNTHVVKEFRTEALRGSTTVRDEQVLLPEQPIRGLSGRNFASEDEFLALDMKNDDASSEISTTNSTFLISASQYFR